METKPQSPQWFLSLNMERLFFALNKNGGKRCSPIQPKGKERLQSQVYNSQLHQLLQVLLSIVLMPWIKFNIWIISSFKTLFRSISAKTLDKYAKGPIIKTPGKAFKIKNDNKPLNIFFFINIHKLHLWSASPKISILVVNLQSIF